MKIFIDTADVQEIREANDMGILDGVTTNPSLVAKSGRKFRDVLEEIVKIVDGPISAEVVSVDREGMMKEAREYAKIHSNITIKLPMTVEGLKALKICVEENIKTNVTLVFNANQALLVGKVGATFVSPFIGRLDDISQIGMDLIRQIRTIYDNYGIKTQILAASIRNPIHFLEAALIGADVATVPMGVIKQLTQHPLTDLGLERFLKDWEKVPK
ncbi:fructose-6-phosphate aldolase [Deltaproteobacteria bacterium PRO3]|nr:fructose-6-phosphate aldolase [Deltaproteobacteria bacterium PRO3]